MKKVPFSPVPKGRADYGSEAAWVEAHAKYDEYQRYLSEGGVAEDIDIADVERKIGSGDSASGEAAPADPGYTYTARVVLTDGTRAEKKIRGIQAGSKAAARRKGRAATEAHVDVSHIDSDENGKRADRANKPRGKSFKKGGDSRRRNDQGQGGSGSEATEGLGGGGGGSGDTESSGQSQDSADGSESSGQNGEGGEQGSGQGQQEGSGQGQGDGDSESQGQQQGDGDSQGESQSQKQQDLEKMLKESIKNALADQSKDAAKQGGQASGMTDLQILRTENPALFGDDALSALGLISAAATAPAFAEICKQVAEAATSGGSVDEADVKRIVEKLVSEAAFDLQSTPTTEGITLDEAIDRKVEKAVEDHGPAQTTVTVVDRGEEGDEVKAQHVVQGAIHKQSQKIVDLLQAKVPVLLVGPTGCGKTYLARQIAEDILKIRFGSLSMTAGISESALIGRWLPTASGVWDYMGTLFQQIFEESGGLFLWDEIDASDPNVMLIVNQALANGHFPLPSRVNNPTAKRHDGFMGIAAANTWGSGADRQYVGRNQLDSATLDRFWPVPLDYDRDVERQIIGNGALLKAGWHIRDAIDATGLRRNLSTRWMVYMDRMIQQGWTFGDCMTGLVGGWTPDEIRKAQIETASQVFAHENGA